MFLFSILIEHIEQLVILAQKIQLFLDAKMIGELVIVLFLHITLFGVYGFLPARFSAILPTDITREDITVVGILQGLTGEDVTGLENADDAELEMMLAKTVEGKLITMIVVIVLVLLFLLCQSS